MKTNNWEESLNINISQLRQWINERPQNSKLVTNEDIRHWLELKPIISSILQSQKEEIIRVLEETIKSYNMQDTEVSEELINKIKEI